MPSATKEHPITQKNKQRTLLRHLRNFPNDVQAIARMNELRLVASPKLTHKGRKVLLHAEQRKKVAA